MMTKNPMKPVAIALALATSVFGLSAATAMAEEAAPAAKPDMPMMGNPQGGMMQGGMMPGGQGGMGMMNPETMQQHMIKMETHMANIEALLRELVQLQKAK